MSLECGLVLAGMLKGAQVARRRHEAPARTVARMEREFTAAHRLWAGRYMVRLDRVHDAWTQITPAEFEARRAAHLARVAELAAPAIDPRTIVAGPAPARLALVARDGERVA